MYPLISSLLPLTAQTLVYGMCISVLVGMRAGPLRINTYLPILHTYLYTNIHTYPTLSMIKRKAVLAKFSLIQIATRKSPARYLSPFSTPFPYNADRQIYTLSMIKLKILTVLEKSCIGKI